MGKYRDYPTECLFEECPCYQACHNPNKFKLSLLESDFEERWISFRVPKQIWERLHFHPCKIEVDLSELLDKHNIQGQEQGQVKLARQDGDDGERP